MYLLDDRSHLQKLDKSNQFEWIQHWDDLLSKSIKAGASVKLPNKFGDDESLLDYSQLFSSIIICGMGGSAISGDYLVSVLFHEKSFNVPIQVIRGYNLPKWVSSKSLVVGVSYSGNTRETLTCIQQAIEARSAIILLSSGGVVEEVAKKYSFPWIELPSGYQPRAAFPIIFGSILGLFDQLFPKVGIKNQTGNFNIIVKEILDKNGPDIPVTKNNAKKLALTLENKIPVFISSESALSLRWKGQFNENAKMIAFQDIFPEIMHNTIQGWENNLLKNLEMIVLKLGNDSNEIIEKIKFSLEIANDNVSKEIHLFEFNNKFLLENLIAATLFGDLVSLYSALIQNLNPSSIRLITEMKNEFEPKLNKKLDIRKKLLNI